MGSGDEVQGKPETLGEKAGEAFEVVKDKAAAAFDTVKEKTSDIVEGIVDKMGGEQPADGALSEEPVAADPPETAATTDVGVDEAVGSVDEPATSSISVGEADSEPGLEAALRQAQGTKRTSSGHKPTSSATQ
jgi:hypothetical protein